MHEDSKRCTFMSRNDEQKQKKKTIEGMITLNE